MGRSDAELPPASGQEQQRPWRVAYLVSHPIQYQAPLLRFLAASGSLDLTVFFLSDFSLEGYRDPGFERIVHWDVPLLEGYRSSVLPAVGRRDQVSFFSPLSHGLRRHLEEGRFDVLWVHGYNHFAIWLGIRHARRLGMRILMRGESHLMSHPHWPLKTAIKRLVLSTLFRRVDGFLAIGSLNREYYRHYGVPPEKIFFMPYAVDNRYFMGKAAEGRLKAAALRVELGLQPDRPVILFASKLQRRKRPMDLLEAYSRLAPRPGAEPRPYLLFVGDGEERPVLERRVKELGWSSVRFLGFKNQSELPAYYALCDVFVLPSRFEPWGLAINEVMNAAKPVVVTDEVGCARDLVTDGVTGFVVPVGDVAVLADRIGRLTKDRGQAERMGAAALERVSRWSFEADLSGLLEAIATPHGSPAGTRMSCPP